MPVQFRWLGVAGIELRVDDHNLLIDPFFTRPSIWRLLDGGVLPDRALIQKHIRGAEGILITHPHWDHLMDAGIVQELTGADVFGSANASTLLHVMGVSENKVHLIHAGDRFQSGVFSVQVYPARHGGTPVDRWINGAVAEGLRLPLRLRDFRMDDCFAFRIEAQGRSVLCGEAPVPSEVLFFYPARPDANAALFQAVRPALAAPLHWDDFLRPLTKPLRPMLQPPRWGWPPTRRWDLDRVTQDIVRWFPAAQVLIPEIFRDYSLDEFLRV